MTRSEIIDYFRGTCYIRTFSSCFRDSPELRFVVELSNRHSTKSSRQRYRTEDGTSVLRICGKSAYLRRTSECPGKGHQHPGRWGKLQILVTAQRLRQRSWWLCSLFFILLPLPLLYQRPLLPTRALCSPPILSHRLAWYPVSFSYLPSITDA